MKHRVADSAKRHGIKPMDMMGKETEAERDEEKEYGRIRGWKRSCK